MLLNDEKELNKIKDFIEFFRYKNRPIQTSMQNILYFWHEAKSEFLFDMFPKGKLIVSKEIEIKAPRDMLKETIEKLPVYHEISSILGGDIKMKQPDTGLETLIGLLNLIDVNNIIENRFMARGTLTVYLKNGKPYNIVNGTKIMKALKKILESYGFEDLYRRFESEVTQIIGTSKFDGHLCLSIHPLDYLTASVNERDWSSCLDWRKDEGYARGAITMMNSPNIVVGYLTSDNMEMFDWNNKKWRQFFYVGKEGIFPIKGYPYDSSELSNLCLEGLYAMCPNKENLKRAEEFSPIKHDYQFITFTMFNDLSEGLIHDFYYNPDAKSKYCIVLDDGADECLSCGQIDVFDGDEVFCVDCENIVRCAECDEIIDLDYDSHFVADYGDDCQNYYCEYCTGDYSPCEHCGEEVPSFYRSLVVLDDKNETRAEVCEKCYNAYAYVLNGKTYFPADKINF